MPGFEDLLPARRDGAKAVMLSVLGAFVLPAGGSAWTSSLLAAGDALGIGEKNARQVLARIADDGIIEAQRHGRQVRWHLTTSGEQLLTSGAERIYNFGVEPVAWEGEWLVVHCALAESQRATRHKLRTQLAFQGFGEIAASLMISPHTTREPELRKVLAELDLEAEATLLRSRTGDLGEDAKLVAKAWSLDSLASEYESFTERFSALSPESGPEMFQASVELVHEWRRFPLVDPELPTELLPVDWAGSRACALFHSCNDAWTATAMDWFAAGDAT